MMAGGAGKEVHRHGLQGFLSNTVSSSFFLAETCSFFLGNAQGESKASEGRRAEMVGTQSSYVLLGVERGPGY